MAEPSTTTPPPGDPAGPTPDPADPAAAEAAAWAEVEARWGEEAAHQAYLSRFPDLDGLTTAGRRYRDALAARPGDARALAMKAEILRRATAVGLALLPRTPPAAASRPRARRLSTFVFLAWIGAALAWILWKLFTGPSP